MIVRILDAAERDLEDGHHFCEKQSQGLGSYFLDSLYSDIDSLSYFGGIHSLAFGYHRLLSKRFPFAVYYQIDKNIVIVKGIKESGSHLLPDSMYLIFEAGQAFIHFDMLVFVNTGLKKLVYSCIICVNTIDQIRVNFIDTFVCIIDTLIGFINPLPKL